MTHDDARLEQALEALLGEGRGAADAAELARLRAELGAAGDVLRARAFTRPRDEARFVARVLARTTREDLSWRGDARLVLEFVRARLKASRALRLVAASLALHLVAAPAVAWWMLHEPEPERRLQVRLEPAPELPFEEPRSAPEPVEDELLTAARAREARENARAAGRFELQAQGCGLAVFEAPAGASPVALLLARRTAWLRSQLGGSATSDERTSAPQASATLAAVLWLEGELDRQALGSEPVTTAARRLAAELEERRALVAEPALATLLASCLWRAWAEGLLEAAPREAPAGFSEAWLDALAQAFAHESGGSEAELVERWARRARAK